MEELNQAFQAVPRSAFLPDDMRKYAAADRPLSIGYEQTNSQPSTVRMMLEWLDPRAGNDILDVGSGSGWTTALLAWIVGEAATVTATERIPELLAFAKQNCAKLGIQNATFHQADNQPGWPQHAPYDRILVSASAAELPDSLLTQLKPGGKMVVPVQTDILEITLTVGDGMSVIRHSGFAFVPLL